MISKQAQYRLVSALFGEAGTYDVAPIQQVLSGLRKQAKGKGKGKGRGRIQAGYRAGRKQQRQQWRAQQRAADRADTRTPAAKAGDRLAQWQKQLGQQRERYFKAALGADYQKHSDALRRAKAVASQDQLGQKFLTQLNISDRWWDLRTARQQARKAGATRAQLKRMAAKQKAQMSSLYAAQLEKGRAFLAATAQRRAAKHKAQKAAQATQKQQAADRKARKAAQRRDAYREAQRKLREAQKQQRAADLTAASRQQVLAGFNRHRAEQLYQQSQMSQYRQLISKLRQRAAKLQRQQPQPPPPQQPPQYRGLIVEQLRQRARKHPWKVIDQATLDSWRKLPKADGQQQQQQTPPPTQPGGISPKRLVSGLRRLIRKYPVTSVTTTAGTASGATALFDFLTQRDMPDDADRD